MTDYSELAKRLRAKGEWSSDKSWESDPDSTEAADALEAQAKEIAELEAALKETLAIAERNELGEYQLRARAALKGEK